MHKTYENGVHFPPIFANKTILFIDMQFDFFYSIMTIFENEL